MFPIVLEELLFSYTKAQEEPWILSPYHKDKIVTSEAVYFPPKYTFDEETLEQTEIEGTGENWEFLGWRHFIRQSRQIPYNRPSFWGHLQDGITECLIAINRSFLAHFADVISKGEKDIMISIRACVPQKEPYFYTAHKVGRSRLILTTGQMQQFEFTMSIAGFGWDVCIWLECLVGIHGYRPRIKECRNF